MTTYNYLPTIKRARLNTYTGVPGINNPNRRQAPIRGLLDFGNNGRVFLTDVAFYAMNAINGAGPTSLYNQLVRIGKWGNGLLTEDFYPLSLLNTKPRQEFGVWEFSKPYRLYPGERLSAYIEYPVGSSSVAGRDITVPAVQFNAVRVVDNRPILLYDNFNMRMLSDAPPPAIQDSSVRLVAEKLQCPADSPVDIYSCTPQPTTSSMCILQDGGCIDDQISEIKLMIYGPDGRQWWDDKAWPFLFDPPGFLMDLNRPEWVLKPGESFFCEFITSGLTEDGVGVTDLTISLRGQVEVVR